MSDTPTPDEITAQIDAAVKTAVAELTAQHESNIAEILSAPVPSTPDPVSEVIASTPVGSVFTRTASGWSVQIPGINGAIGHGVGVSIPEAISVIGALRSEVRE
jgi:hypothetical protein